MAGFKKCGVHPFYQNAIFTFDPVYADSSGETLHPLAAVHLQAILVPLTLLMLQPLLMPLTPQPFVATDSPATINPNAMDSPHSFPTKKVELFSGHL